MTGRGLVTTQAELRVDSALLSSGARPSAAGAADLAPGSALTSPAARRPPRRPGRALQASGRAAATALGEPSCSGAASWGFGPADLRNLSEGWDFAGARGFRGQTQACGKLESAKVSPMHHSAFFFLKAWRGLRAQSSRGLVPI